MCGRKENHCPILRHRPVHDSSNALQAKPHTVLHFSCLTITKASIECHYTCATLRPARTRFAAQAHWLHLRATGVAMPARKRIILLIDDEEHQLRLHEMVLELSGYTVLTASSGRQGLALLASCTVDEVLLDYEMPEMDGGKVAAEIKKIHPGLPILMLSGHEALPESALQFVNGFVSKGNAPTFLQLAIQQLLPRTEKRKLRGIGLRRSTKCA